jgi:hypothetical protein
MKVTEEFIESICDEQGLTNGQKYLLDKWCGRHIVGADIPDIVANFLLVCKGYRGMSQELKDFKGWI